MIAELAGAAAGAVRVAAAAVGAVAGLAAGPSVPPLVDAACEGRLTLRAGPAAGSAELDEVSGVVESRRRAGILWVHNDSGDAARLFALTLSGRTVATVALAGVEAVDWEDVAAGPGPVAGRPYLYVADIGDNGRARETVSVLRLPEPAVAPGSPAADLVAEGVDELVLRYPDGPHDAEALLVDPRSGDLLVLTKELDGRARVYRAPPRLAGGSETVLRRVATLRLGLGAAVTGGDVSRSGRVVALRTYGSVILFVRPDGAPLAAAFRARRCRGIAPPESQGEAIAVRAGGRGYVTLSEGAHPRVHRVGIRPA